MVWHSYQLTYHLLTPLHIGYRRLGNIQRTRYYLPGRNLWGAITARLARACYAQPGPTDYLAVGDYVRDHVVASYFYPKLADGEPYYPRLEQGRWHYGDLSAADFEARFINSFGSTALTASTWTAEEASLHEVEFIAPRAQTGQPPARPVYLQGYLYLDQDRSTTPPPLQGLDDTTILGHLTDLFVGGEQGYGFGRMIWHSEPSDPEVTTGPQPQPRDLDGNVLRSHLRAQQASRVTVQGPLEPLVGREWANGHRGGTRRGAGQDVSEAVVAWAPGGTIEGDIASLVVAAYGIWQEAP
ncbi:MAG: hypothetical protein SXV54_23855 [Chloroflexota bacterium]|nr:hypothetical protein [Chloroflexota bacterium]